MEKMKKITKLCELNLYLPGGEFWEYFPKIATSDLANKIFQNFLAGQQISRSVLHGLTEHAADLKTSLLHDRAELAYQIARLLTLEKILGEEFKKITISAPPVGAEIEIEVFKRVFKKTGNPTVTVTKK